MKVAVRTRASRRDDIPTAVKAGSTAVKAVDVPLELLLAKDLTPAAKLVWIRLRFDTLRRPQWPHHPRQLVKRTCLARSTVYEALRRLAAAGWLSPHRGPKGKTLRRPVCPVRSRRSVRIPADLIRWAHALRPQAILCYGILQALPGFSLHAGTGRFKWAELRSLTGLHLRTLKRAVRALAEARWIALVQKNRRAPLEFRLQHADRAYKEEAERRLDREEYKGESLMRTYLSLLVDTKECEDGARPEFLVNPGSGQRMELDRYYPVHRVAFEFNGRQHYEAAGRFTKQEVAAQKRRDRLKQWICRARNVTLVVVHAEDLSLRGMLQKVKSLLPLRTLRGYRETIRYLDSCAMRYRRAAAAAASRP